LVADRNSVLNPNSRKITAQTPNSQPVKPLKSATAAAPRHSANPIPARAKSP
jgi:hypothetical protein